ncbi:nickel/cobalt transporter [Gymnodinialimonas hymeniacidonis]|uniref:nickel/cobalt transporter n=1 Tax=Gymnodinialimonas hymeniacidonis TaxID=3126508 RepID=UPI0034C62B4A
MRWVIAGVALAVLGAGLWFWLSGGDRVVTAWALEGQRTAQEAMAGALRRLRAGEPAAVAGLMSICFGYGFFHAAGPGHGKLLIGGYGAARAVGAWRLSAVAMASSLAQGLTAIVLVGVGLWLIGWSREQMTDAADRFFAPLSFGAIALVGLWLAFRGARGLWRARQATAHAHDHNHGHGHHHDHDHTGDGHACSTCGHAHGPDPEALAQATGPREVAALIAAIAVRPCTGALFLLILTAQLGVFWAGVAGTVAMSLGTASVTVAVALASVGLRQGVLAGLAGGAALARVQPWIELAVGAVVALLATQLAVAAL